MAGGHRHHQSAAAGLLRRFGAWVAVLAMLAASLGVPAMPLHQAAPVSAQAAPPCPRHEADATAPDDGVAGHATPAANDCCDEGLPCDASTDGACDCPDVAAPARVPVPVDTTELARIEKTAARPRPPAEASRPERRIAPLLKPPITTLPPPSRA
ncbi:hypothetical protein GCM10028794_20010 [Silanimonas algicola]|jgi:hypothetical protein